MNDGIKEWVESQGWPVPTAWKFSPSQTEERTIDEIQDAVARYFKVHWDYPVYLLVGKRIYRDIAQCMSRVFSDGEHAVLPDEVVFMGAVKLKIVLYPGMDGVEVLGRASDVVRS